MADAIRSENIFDFGITGNYLYINIFCYEDIAYDITKKIRNIIYNTSWETTDFISNNEIYKNEAFDDFLIFNNNNIQEISRYYLYCQLKNNLFNKYEFLPDIFEKENYIKCNSTIDENELKILTSFIINATIYGFYTEEEAQKIYSLFSINQYFSLFESIMEKIEVNKSNIEDYYDWISQINELDKNESTNISIYNKSDNNLTFAISYIKLNVKLINGSLFETLVNKIKVLNTSFIGLKMFIYGDIFFELMFYQDKNIKIPYDILIQEEWMERLKKLNIFKNPVDNIGNRYYYVKRNFVLSLIKEQTSLEQKAKDEIIAYQNEGIILDPGKIFDDYQKEYDGKKTDDKELDYTAQYYSNIISNPIFDIYII